MEIRRDDRSGRGQDRAPRLACGAGFSRGSGASGPEASSSVGRPGVGRWLALGAVAVLGCGGPETLSDCQPRKGLKPVCRFHAPEDLAVVSRWLVVSEMPSTTGPGALVAFHPTSGTTQPLYPNRASALATLPTDPDAPSSGEGQDDGGCRAGSPPPDSDFAPHGIDVDGTRLLVVNHGRREAIEEFALSADATGLVAEWKSCTPLPADASANDVVALPDGGFAATKMVERPQWKGIAKLILGLETGALLRYSPATKAWTTVPNSEGRAPNGVEVAADGRFYVAEWGGRQIVRLAPDGSRREVVGLDFSPDNLSWASDGRLLVAGQRGSVLDVPRCAAIEDGACGLASVVVALDPTSLKVSPIVEEDPPTVLGAASIAVEHEGRLWIGAFAGNRLVTREGVR